MDAPIWDEQADLEDPLDVVERVLVHEKCEYDRSDDGDVCFMLPCTWRDYDAWFCWKPEFESLHLNIAFDMRAPQARAADVSRLVSMINEKLWLGHFDIWSEDGAIVFRAGAPFHDTGGPSPSPVPARRLARPCRPPCSRPQDRPDKGFCRPASWRKARRAPISGVRARTLRAPFSMSAGPHRAAPARQ